jgi:hypothetical protein
MKKLKGGLTADARCRTGTCSYREAHTGMVTGRCESNSAGNCVCNAGTSSVVWPDCKATSVIIIIVGGVVVVEEGG